ncbi:EAL domain-containing protein [Dactylosporangium sp. CA-233914]|uniref:EAL domain-containing protein n=1 Tax=Dactylosporangium sp. CA-233914 TaxID=3239934 RepID=UPI003D8EF781
MPADPPGTAGEPDRPSRRDPGAVAAFARVWDDALPRTRLVAGGRERRRRILHEFTDRLADALTGTTERPDVGQWLGRQLVHHAMTDPQMLTASMGVLRSQLLQDLRIEGPGPAALLPILLEDMVAGFVAALTERVRDAAEANARDERAAWREHQQQLQDQARYSLHHDPVTGLPNRVLLSNYLDRVLAGKPASRIAVCRIVLDHPSPGGQAPAIGDHEVRNAATRLRAIATEHDYFVAHVGDEQFVLVNENTTGADDGIKAAEIALRALAQPVAGHRCSSFRAFVGVVEQAVHGATTAALLRAAKTALHWARTDRYTSSWALFDASRSDSVARRRQLADELRAALATSVDVLYQPILRVHDSTIVGVSASPAWRSPDGTTIEGRAVLDLADEAGMRPAVETVMLQTACTQAARWYDSPAPRFVAVDLSSAQLRKPGFVPSVAALLDTSALPPGGLHLAIDDEVLRCPTGDVSAALDQLHRLGVVLAANLVGAGQAMLIDTPVQTVNLDPELTRHLTRDAERYRSATTRTAWIIDMLHDLEYTVAASAVTTLAQYEALHDLGCDRARGGFLARPVPAAGLASLLGR